MNDPLIICPRCQQQACDHDERIIANALATVGTGVMNLDHSVQYRWVSSLRRHARTAFIELQSQERQMGEGQHICLLDLTGQLLTTSGYQFEQRAFILKRNCTGFRLSTVVNRGSLHDPPRWWPLMEAGSAMECAGVIADWLRSGHITYQII